MLDVDDIKYMENNSFVDPFTYHDNYIHTKKVNATKINKKLLNIYDSKENLSIKNIIDDYQSKLEYTKEVSFDDTIKTINQIIEILEYELVAVLYI